MTGQGGDGRLVLRLRYAKLGKLRWLSHRDLARVLERALRRARLPVAYSAGFSPHPLLSFGLALPTGCESLAEYLDVRLEPTPGLLEAGPALPDLVRQELGPALPPGVAVLAAAVLEGAQRSLQEIVTACEWQVFAPGADPASLRRRAAELLAAGSVPVIRQRRGLLVEEDLRPGLLAVRVEEPDADQGAAGPLVAAELATGVPGARPDGLARALGIPGALVRRTHQWTNVEGSRRELLDAGPPALVPEGAAR